MYRWFNRCTGISDVTTEPHLVMEKEETLWCTPHGQVAEMQSRTIVTFTQEKSRSLAARRPDLDGATLAPIVAEALRIPKRPGAPEFLILMPLPDRQYPMRHALPYMVETREPVHQHKEQ